MAATGVYVPMLIQAYLNYDRRSASDGPLQAYVGPITSPNLDALHLDSNLIQHDIFDDVHSGPLFASSDRHRVQPERTGIYVSWTLPKFYRKGIIGSSSAEIDTAKKKAGYVGESENGQPLFHQVPTRWVVQRRILRRDQRGISVQRWKPDQPNVATPGTEYLPYQENLGRPVATQMFVIEGDVVRHIRDIDPEEDIEVTSAPYIDHNLAPSKQGQTFLGKTTTLGDYARAQSINDRFDSQESVIPTTNHVPLTVNRSSNPFFADYQPQNASVFSFFDDLSFSDQSGGKGKYANVNVSYTVVGFHADLSNDPLCAPLADEQTVFDRLFQLGLDVKTSPTFYDIGGASKVRTILHGSLFDIRWEEALPTETALPLPSISQPADQVQHDFMTSHPVSVGTNALDALYGWLRSIPDGDANALTGAQIKQTLLKMHTLLLNTSDDLDSQLQAQDLLSMNNYVPSAHGTEWHLQAATDSKTVKPPSRQAIESLRVLNELQLKSDTLVRRRTRLQRDLFKLWWSFACDRGTGAGTTQAERQQKAYDAAQVLKGRLSQNEDLAITTSRQIQEIKDKLLGESNEQLKEAVSPCYYTQRDPTLFIANLRTAWQSQLPDGELLKIRTVSSTTGTVGPMSTDGHFPDDDIQENAALQNLLQQTLPPSLYSDVHNLLREACFNWSDKIHTTDPPVYFKNGDRFAGSNAWFPLFIEWEAEYYHIPYQDWDFTEETPQAKVEYIINNNQDITLSNIQADRCLVRGRCPVIPAAALVLATTLQQAFDRIGITNLSLSEDEVRNIVGQAKQLDTIVAPMGGFTDQLVTQMRGTHMTPVVNDPTSGPRFSDQISENISADLGLKATDLGFSSTDMETTPFASLVQTANTMPFKPCTHGQFRFSKLNIVDKFGQIVQGVKYTTEAVTDKPIKIPLYPCLGDAYTVQTATTADGITTAKTVVPRTDDLCEFVQLPPSINQDARVNAEFLVDFLPKSGSMISVPELRLAGDYDNPIRGWLVLNYANASIQVFNGDGVFLAEFAALTGKAVTKPFPVDQRMVGLADPFLKALLLKFKAQGYVEALFASLSKTVTTIQATPSSYAESPLSIFGRPLALVTFGVGLELADPPLTNQCTLPGADLTGDSVTDYEFPVKIGDADNVFDGLYGYFYNQPAEPRHKPLISPNTSQYHTYQPSQGIRDHRPISAADVKLRPFYADPTDNDRSISDLRIANSHVISALIDPFTPIHFYTSLLPIKSLKLPEHHVATSLNNIRPFFKTGPILLSTGASGGRQDPPTLLPKYDASRAVKEDYSLHDARSIPLSNGSIQIPALHGLLGAAGTAPNGIAPVNMNTVAVVGPVTDSIGAPVDASVPPIAGTPETGEFAWLQPYRVLDSEGKGSKTEYNMLEVDTEQEKMQWRTGPYTVVEGYLQAKGSAFAEQDVASGGA